MLERSYKQGRIRDTSEAGRLIVVVLPPYHSLMVPPRGTSPPPSNPLVAILPCIQYPQ